MKRLLLAFRSGGVRLYVRFLFVLGFAILFAFLLGRIAPVACKAIYDFLVRFLAPSNREAPSFIGFQYVAPFALMGAMLGSFIGNWMLHRIDNVMLRWDKMDMGDKVTLFLGIFLGLIASSPFLFLFISLQIDPAYVPLIIFGVVTGFAAISVYALQSMADILPWNRGRGRKRRGIKVLDTNVIIDGRIQDVARTGFLEGEIYVPGFVLDELQYIADSHDSLKRQRGRRGLDVLKHMQADYPMEFRVHDKLAPDLGDGVDARLVRLAKVLGADIVTNDWNLNRVAGLQEIKVMNINDLALALRPNVLPQETLRIAIIREGSQPGQGVGYLDDGTMVVVANGQRHMGETHDVTVTQVIQTERGKMIFAEVDPEEPIEDVPPRRPAKKGQ